MARDIFKYLSSIVLCMVMVIFSLFIWERFREKTAMIENAVAQNKIELISGQSLNQENLELSIINGSYTVLNNSKYNVSADLVFKLDKSFKLAIKKENYDLVKGKKYKYKIETNTIL